MTCQIQGSCRFGAAPLKLAAQPTCMATSSVVTRHASAAAQGTVLRATATCFRQKHENRPFAGIKPLQIWAIMLAWLITKITSVNIITSIAPPCNRLEKCPPCIRENLTTRGLFFWIFSNMFFSQTHTGRSEHCTYVRPSDVVWRKNVLFGVSLICEGNKV